MEAGSSSSLRNYSFTDFSIFQPQFATWFNIHNVCRYGSPGNTTKEYAEFADLFLKEYAVPAQQVRSSKLRCELKLSF